jgi:hypothetical protein
LLGHDVPFLKWVLDLGLERRMEIINDPTGESCGMEDFAASYSTSYSMIRLALMYQMHHQQVVVVGPRMQAAFANTSLENIPTDMIRLPHTCFYLATPQSEGLELWGGERTQWHPIVGCYVAMEPTANAIIILAWGAANSKSLDPLDDATFWFRLDLDRWMESQEPDCVHYRHESNLEDEFETAVTDHHTEQTLINIEDESRDIPLMRAIRKSGGKSTVNLDKALNSLLKNRQGEASDEGMAMYKRGQTVAHVEKVKETARKIMRVVINTILYMNSSNAEVSEPVTNESEREHLKARLKNVKNPRKGTGKALQRRLAALPEHKIVWIGPTIEQEVGGERDFTSTGRHVTGHIRRGHWHTFLVGPMKLAGTVIPKEQRSHTIKWISPIWVGSAKDTHEGPRVYGLKEPLT